MSSLILGFIVGVLFMVGCLLWGAFINAGTSRYPDGRCYLCRRGVASPGETCDKCGTEQP